MLAFTSNLLHVLFLTSCSIISASLIATIKREEKIAISVCLIMTSVLSDCFKVIAGKFLDLTIGEARYLCCFKTIVEEHEREKCKLRAKRKGVQENVNVAKNRAEEIVNEVTVWIQNADNIIDENTETKRTCFFGWCPNCVWQ